MYRTYEDPYILEERLNALEFMLEEARVNGASDDEIADIQIEMHEMEERINFAWQDDEYDSLYAAEHWQDDPEFWGYDD